MWVLAKRLIQDRADQAGGHGIILYRLPEMPKQLVELDVKNAKNQVLAVRFRCSLVVMIHQHTAVIARELHKRDGENRHKFNDHVDVGSNFRGHQLERR